MVHTLVATPDPEEPFGFEKMETFIAETEAFLNERQKPEPTTRHFRMADHLIETVLMPEKHQNLRNFRGDN